ncbi:DinB family protein [Paucidesulfovibrio longus]|uniref:DinB family protein n=1 Tax=Paucidesulfovibrio longus TaxID=889 RepID=UPI0003B51176|nr:DinB family protein [Paucidesulfovibrio longus]
MQEIKELLAGLRGAPTVLAKLVEGISAERLHAWRGKGFWTIAQHVAHLAEVQPMLMERLERMIREDCPKFVPFFPDEDTQAAPKPELVVADALDIFRRERSRQLALLDGLDDAAWGREAEHPEYERYGLRILVRHMLMHEYWHMYRIEELWLTKDEYLTQLEG